MNQIFKQLASLFIKTAAIRFGGMAFMFATSVFLARALGAREFGIYGSVMAIAAILAVPAQFGLPQLATRQISIARVNKDWMRVRATLVWFSVLVFSGSIAMIILVAVGYHWLPVGYRLNHFVAYLWGIAVVPVIAGISLGTGILRGFRCIVGANLYDGVFRPGLMLLALLMTYFSGQTMNVGSILALQALCGAAVFLTCTIHILRILPQPVLAASTQRFERRLVASAPPMAGTEISRILDGQYAIILLSMIGPFADVGFFRIALSMAAFISLPMSLINLVAMTHIAEMHGTGDHAGLQDFAKVSSLICFISTLFITLGLIFFGKSFLIFLYGAEYKAAWLPLVLIGLAHTINAFFGSQAIILNMAGEEKSVLKAFSFMPVIGIVVLLSLFPILGVLAAGVAVIFSYLVQSLILSSRAKSRLHLDTAAFPLL